MTVLRQFLFSVSERRLGWVTLFGEAFFVFSRLSSSSEQLLAGTTILPIYLYVCLAYCGTSA